MVYYHIDMEVGPMYQDIATGESDAWYILLFLFIVLYVSVMQYVHSKLTG